ncbi:MAG: LamG-like jellyroll fold domain-containing protein, partial [Candidatus Methylomirabilaceae bacterium]
MSSLLIRVVGLLAAFALTLVCTSGASGQTLPAGFQESVIFSGLTNPTAIVFASDGRVFVAEKSGLIKVFNSLTDTTPDVFADLRTNVHNFWDRGLLGLALHPNFPTTPDVYVLYTHDAAIGGTAPRWGTPGQTSDSCPNPPGATSDGCVVSGRLSRLQAGGNVMVGTEQVLIEDWCQQYPSHSIGALAFGPDGALYVSGGDGASFGFVDYGQDGNPLNPCGDPPVPVGGTQTTPTAEGGALRSQSLRRPAGEPISLDGAILRVDPATGDALPDNPLFGHVHPNARRIVGYGLRNPFRFTIRPGTTEVWVGDVGWNNWEEINHIPNPSAGASNFGWPCYEGGGLQSGYDGANLNICENLYNQANAVTAPFFTYNHSATVVPGETCPTGSSSISGLAFYNGGTYPTTYDGALFFSDYSRSCIWVMFPSTGLIAGYAFEEGSGTTVADASGNGHTGSLNGGVTWTSSGKYGNALSFNGTTGYVSVASPNLPTGDYTWEAWVNPNQTSTFQALLVSRGLGVSPGGLELDLDTGGRIIVWSNGALRMTSATTIPAGAWSHVALTRAGGTLRLYINGTADPNTGTDGVAHDFSTCPLLIGVDNDTGCTGALNGYFAGRLDEIRIYDRALTASEIQANMNTPVSTGSQSTSLPSPTTRTTFVAGAAGPVDLKIGPGGDLFYVDFDGGTIRRVRYLATNTPPTAVIQATPTSGPAPLTVNYDGSGSSDPDPGDTIVSYAWDLDGDGQFDDASTPQVTFTYAASGSYSVRLQVVDNRGETGTSVPTVITVGPPNNPPTATIDSPAATLTWQVGDVISFSGHATDPEDGNLPASRLAWSIILHHCPTNCHTHPLQDFTGVATGSFSGPDHEYPSHLEIKLTATDSGGRTDTKSVLLDPKTVVLSFQSSPSGLQLVVGSSSSATPFSRTVILGSNNSISATSPQSLGGTTYLFVSWSDGGAQTHNITAAATASYSATYT